MVRVADNRRIDRLGFLGLSRVLGMWLMHCVDVVDVRDVPHCRFDM